MERARAKLSYVSDGANRRDKEVDELPSTSGINYVMVCIVANWVNTPSSSGVVNNVIYLIGPSTPSFIAAIHHSHFSPCVVKSNNNNNCSNNQTNLPL